MGLGTQGTLCKSLCWQSRAKKGERGHTWMAYDLTNNCSSSVWDQAQYATNIVKNLQAQSNLQFILEDLTKFLNVNNR